MNVAMTVQRPAMGHARLELALGLALLAAITALRFIDANAETGLTFLYVIPICLLGISFGLRGGLLASGAAIALFTIWSLTEASHLSLLAHLVRDMVFVTVGLITGSMAGRLSRALREATVAEAQFRRGFEDSPIGMAVVGVNGADENRILEANSALADLLATPREELTGLTTLVRCADPAEARELAHGIRALRDGALETYRKELRVLRGDGAEAWVDLVSSIIRDPAGNPLFRLSQLTDISARKHHETQLRDLAFTDALTGVFNRRRFESELELELSAGRDSRGAVCIVDLDSFKPINDTLGHDAGDAAIVRTAEALSARVRGSDVVARFGGDEFALLLRDVEPGEALAVAQELVACVQGALAIELPDGTRPGASIGVAAYGARGSRQAAELLRTADLAMYEAKAGGGGCAVLHHAAAPASQLV